MFLSYFNDYQVLEGGTQTKFRNYSVTPITKTQLEVFQPPRLYCIQWQSKEKHSNQKVIVTQVSTQHSLHTAI
ncbi:hypothetical protein NL466_30030, partial [Klebsiella pneumoniae]|nr:hypothetical protein [Klebsiella pneumoniae]